MENTSVPLNFAARVADAARRFPDQIAIERVGAGGVDATTYRALIERAAGWARWLTARGLRRGERAALLGDNDAAWIAAYLGILQAGAVAVPLDTAYKPTQIRAVIEDSGALVLFTTARYLEAAREAAAPIARPAPEIVLLSDSPADDPSAPFAEVAAHDSAVILYTSGTTADPKGVVLTHRNLEAECVAAIAVFHCHERDAMLGVLPLFHSLAQMANLLLPLSVGARVVFLETVSSTSLLEALHQRGITLFACVPQFFYLIHQRVIGEVAKAGMVRRALFRTMLRTNGWLRDRTGWNPGRHWFARVHRALGSEMRALITGGSRFDPAIGRDLYDLGFTILNGYGLTETSGAATVQRPDDRYTTSVGPPLPGIEVRIAASDRADPERSNAEDGEILIRGPIIMREYFNRPDATREALQDGWLHTGDLGRLDADGRVYITGRRKEIIVLSSGKNLYPEEIEAHYRQSAFIKELCVLGLTRPDQPSAERLHAVIVPDDQALRERGVVNMRELIRFELEGLSVHLPAHKRILTYDIRLDALPRTTTGKLRRHEIERVVGERSRESATAADQRPFSREDREWAVEPAHATMLGIIAARLDRAASRPEANLELDLGLDSMERVELLTALEQAHGSHVPDETRAAIFTVRQLVEAVLSAPPTGIAAAGPAEGRDVVPWDVLLAGGLPATDVARDLGRPKFVRAVCFFGLIRIVALAARVLVGFRATGRHHLPRTGTFIICPNHQSYLDGFVLAAALPFHVVRRLFFVGASEYFETPLMRWLARAVNIVPVDPDANLIAAMQAGAAGLRLNKVLIVFPEGERSIDGELKKFRKGAAILSSHLTVPIVPVALDGLYALWPRSRRFHWRGLLPWRAAPVQLRFGAPLTVAHGAYPGGTAAVAEAVETMFKEFRE